MDDAKRVQREAEETAKETMRKMDGTTDLDDKVANLGDDINKNLGNAGDAAREAADDLDDNQGTGEDDRRERRTSPTTAGRGRRAAGTSNATVTRPTAT